MKIFCKYSLSGGGNFNPTNTLIKGFLSLLLITTTLTACNDADEAIPSQASNKLNITVGLNTPQSRTIITGNTLPDASVVGVRLDDDEATDYDDYAALAFTASTVDAKQVWTPNTDVVLSETEGTIYAYWPYSSTTDITAIQVDVTAAEQTDWLYATPVENVNESNASVPVTLNHMLTNVKIAINRGTYVGTGNISNITIQSDGFATGGTFNAAQATPAFTAVTGTGDELSRSVTATLGGTATDIMVVPTGTSKAVTFTATIDDVDYTVTSSDVELEEGKSYEYTLSLNSTFMSIASVAVNPWTSVPKDDLTLEKVQANANTGPAINSAGKANGVYAVTATGELIDYNTADNTCIGVALIVNDAPTPQRIMIEKTQSYDATNTIFYWGTNLYDKDVSGITNWTGGNGYLPKADGTYPSTPNLSSDYTTWTSGELSDFNGKNNTNAIITAYTEHSVDMDARDMCKVLQTFNAGTYGSNQGFTDWYIPACGQLALIYLNKTAINEALTAIGGTTFDVYYYWSSSECSYLIGWYVSFDSGGVNGKAKNINHSVRFVRDI